MKIYYENENIYLLCKRFQDGNFKFTYLEKYYIIYKHFPEGIDSK